MKTKIRKRAGQIVVATSAESFELTLTANGVRVKPNEQQQQALENLADILKHLPNLAWGLIGGDSADKLLLKVLDAAERNLQLPLGASITDAVVKHLDAVGRDREDAETAADHEAEKDRMNQVGWAGPSVSLL